MSAPTVQDVVDQVQAALPGTRVTTFGPGALYDTILVATAGKDLVCPLRSADKVCTYEVCHYPNDPAKQKVCPIC